MNRILRLNMTNRSVTWQEVPETYAGLGGRALTSRLIRDEVPPTCHPLGPFNKLVLAPGLLTGTPAANTGRISVGGKSPLTGGIKESNSGGLVSIKLARLGIKAVVVEGHPVDDAFSLVKITKDGVEFLPGRRPRRPGQLRHHGPAVGALRPGGGGHEHRPGRGKAPHRRHHPLRRPQRPAGPRPRAGAAWGP